MDDFNIFDFNYMQEAYIGKGAGNHNELYDCEILLNSMCETHINNPKVNLNKTQENKDLQKLLKQLFGLDSICIYWSNGAFGTSSSIVGYNFFSSIKNTEDYYIQSNNQYYDRDHNMNIIIDINTSIINRYSGNHRDEGNIYGGHLLALILKNIAKNFNRSSYNIIKGTLAIVSETSSLIVTEVLNSNLFKPFIHTIRQLLSKMLDKLPHLKVLFIKLSNVLRIIEDITYTTVSATGIEYILNLILSLMKPTIFFMSMTSRQLDIEYTNFVTAYGYGKELNEITLYLETKGFTGKLDIAKGSILTRIVYDIALSMQILLQNSFGNTKSHSAISYQQVKKLKNDLERGDFPIELKQTLEKEISDLENYVNECNDKTEDDKLLFTNIINEAFSK